MAKKIVSISKATSAMLENMRDYCASSVNVTECLQEFIVDDVDTNIEDLTRLSDAQKQLISIDNERTWQTSLLAPVESFQTNLIALISDVERAIGKRREAMDNLETAHYKLEKSAGKARKARAAALKTGFFAKKNRHEVAALAEDKLLQRQQAHENCEEEYREADLRMNKAVDMYVFKISKFIFFVWNSVPNDFFY